MTNYAEQSAPVTRENAGYIIQKAEPVPVHPSDRPCEIVLGFRPSTPGCCPFVVWTCYGHDDYNFGHYFKNQEQAEEFFWKKVKEEKRTRRECGWTYIKT